LKRSISQDWDGKIHKKLNPHQNKTKNLCYKIWDSPWITNLKALNWRESTRLKIAKSNHKKVKARCNKRTRQSQTAKCNSRRIWTRKFMRRYWTRTRNSNQQRNWIVSWKISVGQNMWIQNGWETTKIWWGKKTHFWILTKKSRALKGPCLIGRSCIRTWKKARFQYEVLKYQSWKGFFLFLI
jgi:hypothetical protein